jgi:hypothetical protein
VGEEAGGKKPVRRGGRNAAHDPTRFRFYPPALTRGEGQAVAG